MSCRLYVEPGSLMVGPRVITGHDHTYLFRVRRLRAGDAITLFDGQGREAVARVRAVGPGEAQVDVEAPVQVTARPGCALTVAQALIKGERMDWCIQKLVELGVRAIIPVQTERSVVKLEGERARKRRTRLIDIARDAARQSRRATVPEIHEIVDLAGLWPRVAAPDWKLVLWEGEQAASLRAALAREPPGGACVLVGPEGGLTQAEVEAARRAGFSPVSLGRSILRAETAAVAVAAVLGVAFGDLSP